MSVDNYREQVKNPVILEYIREEMDMKDVPLSSCETNQKKRKREHGKIVNPEDLNEYKTQLS